MATDVSGQSSFARSLEQLKRRGSNLLVVGPPSPKLRQAVSRRLVGDATAGPRRRLYVFTGDEHVHPRLGNGPLGPDTTRVVERTEAARGTATAGEAVGVDNIPRERVPAGKLSPLAWAAGDEINELSREAGGFSPGELRVCVDSLAPLFAGHDDTEIRRFLHVMGNRVRSTGGMAHYHLPAPRDDPTVERFADAFDAVIELRMRAGAPEHQWFLPGEDVESGWVPL